MASFPGFLQLLTKTLHLLLHIICHMSSSASSRPSSSLRLLSLWSLLSCRRHHLAKSSTPPVSHSSASCAFYSRQYLFYFSSFLFWKQIRLTTTFKISTFHITTTLFKTPRHHNDIYPYINNYDNGIWYHIVAYKIRTLYPHIVFHKSWLPTTMRTIITVENVLFSNNQHPTPPSYIIFQMTFTIVSNSKTLCIQSTSPNI